MDAQLLTDKRCDGRVARQINSSSIFIIVLINKISLYTRLVSDDMDSVHDVAHDKRPSEFNRLMSNGNFGKSDSIQDDADSRPSQTWFYSKVTPAESLDFEETESVMWRKVSIH
jgi:hypothetical protein